MATPTVKITSQARSGNGRAVTFTGTISGTPTSGTITLPAAATPNGAVTVNAVPITLNNNSGRFTVTLSNVAYGNYAGATVTVSNADGSSSDTGVPFRLYTNGTQPVGLPVVDFPPLPSPTLAVARVGYGQIVTDFTLQGSSTSQSNAPFYFAQPFKVGDLSPDDFLVGKVEGESDIPLQFNVKALHNDGSVRHAIVSGVIPSLTAGELKTVKMVRSATGTSTTPLLSTGLTSSTTVEVKAVFNGAVYTARMIDAISNATVWIGGQLVTDFTFSAPFLSQSSVAHPSLTAQFSVKYFPTSGKSRVDVTVEHTSAYTATTDLTYDAEIKIDGVVQYSKTGLVHFPLTRWRKIYWTTPTDVHVKHNIDYLYATRAVPNYDRRVAVSETTLNNYTTDMNTAGFFDPMSNGRIKQNMEGTGGDAFIGLAPGCYAAAILSMDKRAKEYMLLTANAAGSYSAHRRNTNGGPTLGKPLDIIHFPRHSRIGSAGDTTNPATGMVEGFPARTTTSKLVADISHQPAVAYIPYLLTGDFYYLEELLFWGASYNFTGLNPAYRFYEQGLLYREQTRGAAWAFRTTAECAYILPDDHYAKRAFLYWVENNLEFYNTRYTDGSNNTLGIVTDSSIIYAYGDGNNGIGSFQDDFITQSMGHAAELGFSEAARFLKWKAKFPVGRMIDPAVCWFHAAKYTWKVRPTTTGALFTTMKDVYENSILEEERVLGCNTQPWLDYINSKRAMPSNAYVMNDMEGYAYGTEGFTSVLQPALAYAVDAGYEDADLAWELFESRAVKPDYGLSPQFAIVPRGNTITMTLPTDGYAIGSGQTMYIGCAAPVIKQGFDSLSFFTVSDGRPGNNELGKPLVVDLHGSSGQGNAQGYAYTATVSGNMAIETHKSFNFYVVAAYTPLNGVNHRYVKVRPIDQWMINGIKRESMHLGFQQPDGRVYLTSEHRYDAMMDWVVENLTQYDLNKRCLSGGSMGAWGTITYGIRRHNMFAALYPDRPRWRYGYSVGTVAVPSWNNGWTSVNVSSSPLLADEDGGTSYAQHLDMIAYISNPANKVRPILWCCGKNDGFMPWSEQCDAVDALRATGRAFAFAWNEGNHTTGSIMGQILQSYNYGTYSLDKGYPLFTEHSLDKDPRVDPAGGINIGLTFRNVVETANGWSCEVTSVLGPCTVKVKPISEVFKASVEAQLVEIPAANTWRVVTFNA